MTAPSQQREGYSASSATSQEALLSSPSLPSRTEFGHDHYAYIDGQRMRVGSTRTLRPTEGETGVAFRQRVDDLAHQLLLYGTLQVDEEIRGGAIVQVVLRLHIDPEPAPILDDARAAGGRPSGPRGRRGGS